MLPGEFEEYQLQREFFIDVIRLAPEDTDLHITIDSWDGLRNLFGNRMVEREGEWIVSLDPENRRFLVQQALADNLQVKFVHFFLLHKGAEILTSFDRMCSLFLDESFPSYKQLMERHAVILA
ncbi:MAG: hypothetical protein JWP58_4581 [Hymenobacter sp.]|nr:hypothetical protein [Hymenobacter sp.]